MWTFYCYDDHKDPDLWARWWANDADQRDKGAHNQTIDVIEKQEYWSEPTVKALGNGLFEIKFKGSKQWRIIGFYFPKGKRRVFTILIICYHKQRRYYPPNAIKTARKRKKDIEQGNARVRESVRPD